ncbi:MAG: hypothetical protein PHS92_00950 [Candidatus Gracilibacteria bacterium]|nr:hypothetical protein [Candidatus Gracilibacteria bacterium]
MNSPNSKVVIPFGVVEKYYFGGVNGFLTDFKDKINILLDDKNIHIKGSQYFPECTNLIDFWRNRGVKVFKMKDGEIVWDEICFVDENGKIPNYRCDWI